MPEDTTQISNYKPRGKPSSEGRFIWIASLAAERIVNKLGATEAAYGMAVYVALCRLSSQAKNVPTVEATIQEIAGMARISYTKTRFTLDALETQAKVISIERRERSKGEVKQPPHTYTLLALRRHTATSGRHHDTPSADVTHQASYYTKLPKETPLKGELDKKETTVPQVGSASQPTGKVVSSKITWEGKC